MTAIAITALFRRIDLAAIQAAATRRLQPGIDLLWIYGGPDPKRAAEEADRAGAALETIRATTGHDGAEAFKRQVYQRAATAGRPALYLEDDAIPFAPWPQGAWERRYGNLPGPWTAAHLTGEPPEDADVWRCAAFADLPKELAGLGPAYLGSAAKCEIVAGSVLHLDKCSVGHSPEQAAEHVSLVRALCRILAIDEPREWDVRVNRPALAKIAAGIKGLAASTQKRRQADPATIERRLAICESCPQMHDHPLVGWVCGRLFDIAQPVRPTCGCILHRKAKVADATCPLGSWP